MSHSVALPIASNLKRLALRYSYSLQPENLAHENYAADLHLALDNELATSESARQFFASTFQTDGLSQICRRIFHRLTFGDASNEPSIYRLDSAFGGGKTHTLIALAGAAQHPSLIRAGATPVPTEYTPISMVRIAPFTGENTNLETGTPMVSNNDVRAKSLIGQLAWQIGGSKVFEQFRPYDENLTSPSSADIGQLLGNQPCLILIDELVQWLRRFNDERFRNRLEQVTVLCSALAKAVELCPRAVLVFTTPDPASDAYRDAAQQVHEILGEIESVLSRTMYQAMPTSPDGQDWPDILRKRLFKTIDDDLRREVSETYAHLYNRAIALIAPPPQEHTLQRWFYQNYPFHPDTLRIITDRLASNSNFQRARGALRLLSKSIFWLQQSGQDTETLLVHPHHIDPANPEIRGELTSRINQQQFDAAISADITNVDSTANRIDETRPVRPANRLTRAMLLASLTPIRTAQGLSRAELVRATLTPQDTDPLVVDNAIVELQNQALYINDNPRASLLHFTTVPNLNRMLLERRNAFGAVAVKDHIHQAITRCFTPQNRDAMGYMATSIFPSVPNLPDNPKSVSLGIINYEWIDSSSSNLEANLTHFYRNSPLNEGTHPRQYKNNIALLVADPEHDSSMERHARRWLAAADIKNNPPSELQSHQRLSLETELSGAERDLFIAIQRLYAHLYFPSIDHPVSTDTLLQHFTIRPEVAAEKPQDGQHAIIKLMTDQRKLLTTENADLNPESWWRQHPNLKENRMNLAVFLEEFSRQPRNYMLLNWEVARKLLGKALDRRVIVIRKGTGQIITAENELTNIDDSQAVLYLADNACPSCREFNIAGPCACETPPLPPLVRCELCGELQESCKCPSHDSIPNWPTSSGSLVQPLNVLARDLRRHMADYQAESTDIGVITLFSDKADFIEFVAGMLGPSENARVSYHLSREPDIRIDIKNMDLGEWSRFMLGRVAPAFERIKDAEVTDVTVEIPSDANSPATLESILNRMPTGRTGGMTVTFKDRMKRK